MIPPLSSTTTSQASPDLLLEHIAHAHNPDAEAHRIPWYFQGHLVGSISDTWRELATHHLGHKLDATSLSQVHALCQSIRLQVSQWMDEPFGLYIPSQITPIGQVPRGAVSHLGLQAYGVHANGFVRKADGIHMWVAKRSMNKPTFPGQWDNMVGGGLTAGFTPDQVLAKETDEEAGLQLEQMLNVEPVGILNYQHSHAGGLRNDRLVIYDLELPEGLTPHPKDGEVERFECWPLDQLRQVVSRTREFKYNCNLVIMEFLLRHSALDDHPDKEAIAEALNERFQPT